MPSLQKLWLSCLVVAVAVAPALAFSGTVGSAGAGTSSTSNHVITSCRTIDEPGRYVLGGDVKATDPSGNFDTCIVVTADDVVIDGQGHTLRKTAAYEEQTAIPLGIEADGGTNLTVRDITVTGWWMGITTDSPGLTVENITARQNAIGVNARTSNSVVRDSVFVHNMLPGSGMGIGARLAGDHNRVVNSTFRNNSRGMRVDGASDVVVRNNTFTGHTERPRTQIGTHYAVMVTQSSSVRITNNEFRIPGTADGNTILLRSWEGGTGSIVVAENTIEGSQVVVRANHTRIERNRISTLGKLESAIRTESEIGNVTIRANYIWNSSDGVTVTNTPALDEPVAIRNNTITGTHHGVTVTAATPVRITGNDLSGNNVGVGVTYPGNGSLVDIHRNSLADTIVGVETPFIETPVSATRNYWGADGPGSRNTTECGVQQGPLEDPVTGTLADGGGANVTEGQTEGVAGAHFDPWLDSAPTAVGAPDSVTNESTA